MKTYKTKYYLIQLAVKDLKRLGFDTYILKGKNYSILAIKNSEIRLVRIVDIEKFKRARPHHLFTTFGYLSTSVWTKDKIHKKWRKREIGIGVSENDRTSR